MKSKCIIGIFVVLIGGLFVIAGCQIETPPLDSTMKCDDGRLVSISEGCDGEISEGNPDDVYTIVDEVNLKEDFVAEFTPRIAKEKAIEIAKNSGLEGNPDNWRIQYYLYTSLNIYVWSVENILGSGEYSAGGKSIIIDADTGKIIKEGYWQMVV